MTSISWPRFGSSRAHFESWLFACHLLMPKEEFIPFWRSCGRCLFRCAGHFGVSVHIARQWIDYLRGIYGDDLAAYPHTLEASR